LLSHLLLSEGLRSFSSYSVFLDSFSSYVRAELHYPGFILVLPCSFFFFFPSPYPKKASNCGAPNEFECCLSLTRASKLTIATPSSGLSPCSVKYIPFFFFLMQDSRRLPQLSTSYFICQWILPTSIVARSFFFIFPFSRSLSFSFFSVEHRLIVLFFCIFASKPFTTALLFFLRLPLPVHTRHPDPGSPRGTVPGCVSRSKFLRGPVCAFGLLNPVTLLLPRSPPSHVFHFGGPSYILFCGFVQGDGFTFFLPPPIVSPPSQSSLSNSKDTGEIYNVFTRTFPLVSCLLRCFLQFPPPLLVFAVRPFFCRTYVLVV